MAPTVTHAGPEGSVKPRAVAATHPDMPPIAKPMTNRIENDPQVGVFGRRINH